MGQPSNIGPPEIKAPIVGGHHRPRANREGHRGRLWKVPPWITHIGHGRL